jgi:four helix bundle protein
MKKQITKFEDLKIWQGSHKLAMEIYTITKKFPKEELFGLISQIRRSALSIPTNILEGFYRHTTKELVQFLYTSRGSSGEVIYHLLVSKDLGYISNEKYLMLRQKYEYLSMSINALINILSKK